MLVLLLVLKNQQTKKEVSVIKYYDEGPKLLYTVTLI